MHRRNGSVPEDKVIIQHFGILNVVSLWCPGSRRIVRRYPVEINTPRPVRTKFVYPAIRTHSLIAFQRLRVRGYARHDDGRDDHHDGDHRLFRALNLAWIYSVLKGT